MTVRNAASMGTHGSMWQAHGYSGGGSVGSLIDCLQGRPAIIVGGAHGVFNELRFALRVVKNPVVFAVNDVGMFLPHVDHWISLHSDALGPWKNVRWAHSLVQDHTKYHSVDPRPYIDYVWERLTPCFAISGYFAMQIAWIMGASPIVLAGCPGERKRRFFEMDARPDFSYGGEADAEGVRKQLESEMERLPDFRQAVRSMSGWTRSYFGGI